MATNLIQIYEKLADGTKGKKQSPVVLAEGVKISEDTSLKDLIATLATTTSVDEKIAALVDGAPETLDTLKELADALEANEDMMTAITAAIALKLDKTEAASTYEPIIATKKTAFNVDFGTTSGTAYDGALGQANAEAIAALSSSSVTPEDLQSVEDKVDLKLDKTEAATTYEPIINIKNNAFNVDFGTIAGTAYEGSAGAALAIAVSDKVDKVEGKGLSTNDLTDDLLAMLNADGLTYEVVGEIED